MSCLWSPDSGMVSHFEIQRGPAEILSISDFKIFCSKNLMVSLKQCIFDRTLLQETFSELNFNLEGKKNYQIGQLVTEIEFANNSLILGEFITLL